MKLLFASLLILSITLEAYAHPGKTDRQGGHKCYKECAEWDLFYAEYHLHDKDGRPVKVAKKKPVKPGPKAAIVPANEPEPAEHRGEGAVPPVVAAAGASSVEPGPDHPSLQWILLLLFLLLLLAVRRRRTGCGTQQKVPDVMKG